MLFKCNNIALFSEFEPGKAKTASLEEFWVKHIDIQRCFYPKNLYMFRTVFGLFTALNIQFFLRVDFFFFEFPDNDY